MNKLYLVLLLIYCAFCNGFTQRFFYVDINHPASADNGDGTSDQPFRTINSAALIAKAGDTVFVKEGIYRERVTPEYGGNANSPVVYLAESHRTIIRGSEILKTNWKKVKSSEPVYATKMDQNIFDGYNPFLVKAESLKGKRTLGQVFVDGKLLSEVDNLNDVYTIPGTWIIDEDRLTLTVHFENRTDIPQKLHIEVTARNRIFAPKNRGLGYIVVSGFTMEHCGNQFPGDFWVRDRQRGNPQGGALSTRSGNNWIIENNIIQYANTLGIDCGTEGGYDFEGDQPKPDYFGYHTIRNNIIRRNGTCGIAGAGSPGTKIVYNLIEENNYLGWTSPEVGGIKVHWFTDGLIEGNILKNNDAHGIWLDNGCINSRVTRNVVIGSRGSGIFIELADGPCMVDNNIVAYTHAGDGIYTHDASGVTVVHNLLYCNEHFGVLMRTVTDRKTRNTQGERIPVGTHNQTVMNNIFIDNYRGQISFPVPIGEKTYNNVSDYNLFITGSTWKWEGLIRNPFVLNKDTKDGTTQDDVTKFIMKNYRKFDVEFDSVSFASFLALQSALTLDWWQKSTGNDIHSFAPAMADATLENGAVAQGSVSFSTGELYFEVKESAPFKQLFVPMVEGMDFDFFGLKITGDKVMPGPFQYYKDEHNRFVLNAPEVKR